MFHFSAIMASGHLEIAVTLPALHVIQRASATLQTISSQFIRLLKKGKNDERGTLSRRGYTEPQRKTGRQGRHRRPKSHSSVSLSSPLRLCVERFLFF